MVASSTRRILIGGGSALAAVALAEAAAKEIVSTANHQVVTDLTSSPRSYLPREDDVPFPAFIDPGKRTRVRGNAPSPAQRLLEKQRQKRKSKP